MKFRIQHLDELTDGREILESKPHPFAGIFIGLLLSLILIFLIWAWFSEKEILVKIPGIVRPNDKIYAITNSISGTIKEIYFKNGEKINKDDVLYEIDDSDYIKKNNELNKQIEEVNYDIDNLNKLSKCLKDNKNYFDKSNEKEKSYFYKYESYKAMNNISSVDSNEIINNKNELNSKITSLNKLLESISNNKNYNEKDSIYENEYNCYTLSKVQIENKINDLNSTYNDINSHNHTKEQLDKLQNEINNTKALLEKNKIDFTIKTKQSIDELTCKLNSLDCNLQKINESTKLNNDKNENTILGQLEDKIKDNKSKIEEIKCNKAMLETSISDCKVKANTTGILNIINILKPGMILPVGTNIATILPDNNNYKIDLMIPVKDIGNLKEGQVIKYKFPSFPYAEYGFLEGTLDNLSVDSNINSKTGLSFYSGTSTINGSTLYSHKKEKVTLRAGMDCEACIITRKEKMLYYLLEKFNLKD